MAQGPRGTVDRGIMLNGYFFFILSAVVGIYLLDLIGRLFNLSALRSDLPDDFSDVYDAEELHDLANIEYSTPPPTEVVTGATTTTKTDQTQPKPTKPTETDQKLLNLIFSSLNCF